MSTYINDLLNNVEAKTLYFNADISAAQADGSAVDVKDGQVETDGIVTVLVDTLTSSEGDYTFTVSHSATSGGTFTALGTVQVTSAEAGTPQLLRVRNIEKFLKVTLVENTGEVTVATVPAFVTFHGVKTRI